jgi:DNA-binding NtrC family response regulator
LQEKFQVLLVDDEPDILRVLERALKPEGYQLYLASTGGEAFEIFRQENVDLVLLDIQLPDMPGLEVLRVLKENDPDVEVVIITGYPTINRAVESIRLGAYDFLAKPFNPIAAVQITVKQALERRQIIRENQELREHLEKQYQFENLIGRSKAMQNIFKLVKRLSQSESTILIRGETGTGKEVLARSIHFNSPRKNKRFIPVDCGAIPESLIESELFGHVRGAFTGAHRDKKGLFREADGGTILLDEIGDLSLALQMRLLRVLQEREIRPVGGEQAQPVDVRVISATHRDLEERVKSGEFREDLFYRLNVLSITIPALRDRPEDIPLLIQHFLSKYSKDVEPLSIEPQAMKRLCNYPWPGNVRQLEHCIEQMVVLRKGNALSKSDIPGFLLPAAQEQIVPPGSGSVKEFERLALKRAMENSHGNVEQAAKILGIAKSSLYRKLKDQGLPPKKFLKK